MVIEMPGMAPKTRPAIRPGMTQIQAWYEDVRISTAEPMAGMSSIGPSHHQQREGIGHQKLVAVDDGSGEEAAEECDDPQPALSTDIRAEGEANEGRRVEAEEIGRESCRERVCQSG